VASQWRARRLIKRWHRHTSRPVPPDNAFPSSVVACRSFCHHDTNRRRDEQKRRGIAVTALVRIMMITRQRNHSPRGPRSCNTCLMETHALLGLLLTALQLVALLDQDLLRLPWHVDSGRIVQHTPGGSMPSAAAQQAQRAALGRCVRAMPSCGRVCAPRLAPCRRPDTRRQQPQLRRGGTQARQTRRPPSTTHMIATLLRRRG
jgi:hypothetical protein